MVKILVLDDSSLGKNILLNFSENEIVRHNYKHFKDGEISVELLDPVRGDDIILISSICEPVNENLMKVLICMDSLKRSSAKSINLVAPYLGYSRKDKRVKPWQPLTARLIANLLETAGASSLTTCDLHAKQIEGFYDIPVDNIPVQLIMGKRWKNYISDTNTNTDDFTVVSPDHGGVTRAREFMIQAELNNLVIINKMREKANEVASMQVLGDVKGKTCIIVDDLVDTGGTLCRAASELKKQGAKDVYVYCTHGVLSDCAIQNLSEFNDITRLFITNTIDKSAELINDKISYIDISDIITGVIKAFKENRDINNYINEEFLK